MSDALWLGGLAVVLGAAHMLGGMLLLIVVAVLMTVLFKVLGDNATCVALDWFLKDRRGGTDMANNCGCPCGMCARGMCGQCWHKAH